MSEPSADFPPAGDGAEQDAMAAEWEAALAQQASSGGGNAAVADDFAAAASEVAEPASQMTPSFWDPNKMPEKPDLASIRQINNDLATTQLRLTRDLTTTEANALAKEREEADLRRKDQVDAWMARNRPQAVFLAAATVGGTSSVKLPASKV